MSVRVNGFRRAYVRFDVKKIYCFIGFRTEAAKPTSERFDFDRT